MKPEDWIPVTERLPANQSEVLAKVSDSHLMINGQVLVACYFEDESSWTVYDFERVKHDAPVTHWMPIVMPQDQLKPHPLFSNPHRHPLTCCSGIPGSNEDCERNGNVDWADPKYASRDAGELLKDGDRLVCPCGAYSQPANYTP